MIDHQSILSHFSWINVSFKWNGNVMSIVDSTGLTTFLIELLWLLLAKLAYCFISLNERKYGVVLFYAINYWIFIINLLHNTSETYYWNWKRRIILIIKINFPSEVISSHLSVNSWNYVCGASFSHKKSVFKSWLELRQIYIPSTLNISIYPGIVFVVAYSVLK